MNSIQSALGNFMLTFRALHQPAGLSRPGSPGVLPGVVIVAPLTGEGAASRYSFELDTGNDNSGSMSGKKNEDAKGAVLDLLETAPDIGIRSLTFSDTAVMLGHAPAGDPAAREALKQHVRGIGIAGGTRMSSALRMIEGLGSGSGELVRYAVLATDGQTFGDETECVEIAERLGRRGVVLSVFATDDANLQLLRRLCDLTGGQLLYLNQLDRSQLSRFLQGQATTLASVMGRALQLQVRPVEGVTVGDLKKVYPDIINRAPSGSGVIDLGDLAGGGSVAALVELRYADPGVEGTFCLAEVEVAGTFGGQPDRAVLPLELAFSRTATPVQDPVAARLFYLAQADAHANAAASAPDFQSARTQLAQALQKTRLAGDPQRTRVLECQLARVTQVGAVDGAAQRTLVQAVRSTRVISQ